MGTKTSIGLGLALLLVVVAVILRFGIADKTEIDAAKKEAEHSDSMTMKSESSNHSGMKANTPTNEHHGHDQPTQHVDDRDVVNTEHLDQLTPEMKQAIRDKLFQHGPKTTYTKPDGTIMQPANGRFTQMPVAVQMPDGTIQIREYSEIPE